MTKKMFIGNIARIGLLLLGLFGIGLKPAEALDYYAEHSIPASNYQDHFDLWSGDGYRVVLVTGFDDADGNVFYNAIWLKNTDSITWRAYHGIQEADYQDNFDENTGLGYRPVFVDGFSVDGAPFINVIYHLETEPPEWSARHGQTSAQYQSHFDSIVPKGFDLDVVSTYEISGTQRLANLFSRYTNTDAWEARHGLSSAQYQAEFDDLVGNNGYNLFYVSAGTRQGNTPLFSALFVKNNGQPAWKAFHDLPNDDLQSTLDDCVNQGYIPWVIDGYRSGSSILWALLVIKEGESLDSPSANDATFPETACFDEKITDFMKANEIPGANAAVLKDGKLVYAQGYGSRDVPGIGNQAVLREVSQCTPFRVASISKSISSFVILRMIQAELLSLNDRVFGTGGILQSMSDNPDPCCPIVNEDWLNRVTIQNLLTHTGGWDIDILDFDPMFRSKTISSTLGITGPAQCDDVIYYMFGQGQQHFPGTVYAYSNFGYCILGRVIEQLSGLSYEAATRKFLLTPAGVSTSEMYLGSTQLMDIPEAETEYWCPGCALVTSVFPSETNMVPNPYGSWHLEAMDAHGGWVASARQLMYIISAVSPPHCNGTTPGGNEDICLLWDTSLADLVEKISIYDAGDVSWYGLGFSVRNSGTDQNWWHSGSLPGTSTIMVRANEGYGYAWALLFNRRGFDGNMDSLMWDAVGCVNDAWPGDFESSCGDGDDDDDDDDDGCLTRLGKAWNAFTSFFNI